MKIPKKPDSLKSQNNCYDDDDAIITLSVCSNKISVSV